MATTGNEQTIYAASNTLLETVLDNLKTWHDFNTHLQTKQQELLYSIEKANEHFDGLRESKQFQLAQKFINEAQLQDESLRLDIIQAMNT